VSALAELVSALPELFVTLSLAVNEDLRSRFTYSELLRKLDPAAIAAFVLAQFDRCGLKNLECAAWRRFGFGRREAAGRP